MVSIAQSFTAATSGKRLNPHGFEVDVCETVLPFDRQFTASRGGPVLPVARRKVRQAAVLGGAGCKPNDQDGCGLDDPAWAFPARQPHLVIHVGDYNYRGIPSGFEQTVNGQKVQQWYYDAGDGAEPSERCEMPGPYYSQNSTDNPDRDAWQAWLGEALPHLSFAPPRVVALEGLSLAVLDSANACDELPNFTDRYAGQLTALNARLQGDTAWLMSHRPVWGVEGEADGPIVGCDGQTAADDAATPAFGVLNRTLQCAFAGPAGSALLPKLDLLLGTAFTPSPAAWSPNLEPCPAAGDKRPFLCVEGLGE